MLGRIPYKNETDHVEELRTLAYSLWEDAGRPENKALDFWLKAKELLGIKEQSCLKS